MLNFENELKKLLAKYEKPRPFICDGNPLKCEVFIVGINAATEMDKDFWEFWSSKTGFKKEEWLGQYILERSLKPLKPNKTRRNKVSNTRQRIEWIVDSIKPVKTLETNLFVKATPTADELKKEDRESLIFEYLFRAIKPKILFTHGNEVREYLERIFDITIIKDKINEIEIVDINTKVISMRHLSRGWSKAKSIEIGEKIKGIINNKTVCYQSLI